MRRVFKTRHFNRWMRKTDLTDAALCAAVQEMAQGLIDADMGGAILKKRVALPGRGKSGGVRTLIATHRNTRWFFVYGFEKSERPNISPDELQALQDIAQELLVRTDVELQAAATDLTILEICHE